MIEDLENEVTDLCSRIESALETYSTASLKMESKIGELNNALQKERQQRDQAENDKKTIQNRFNLLEKECNLLKDSDQTSGKRRRFFIFIY